MSSEWREKAACRTEDATLFFPHETDFEAIDAARRICFSLCPVRQECLSYAVDTNEKYGIWGGLTLRERKNRKRRLISNPDERVCPRCERALAPSMFGKDRSRPDGVMRTCRQCVATTHREARARRMQVAS